jgi:hypothetical protein
MNLQQINCDMLSFHIKKKKKKKNPPIYWTWTKKKTRQFLWAIIGLQINTPEAQISIVWAKKKRLCSEIRPSLQTCLHIEDRPN